MSQGEREQPSAELPLVAGPQREPAVGPEPPAVAPRVLSPEQLALLNGVLNRLVPANGDLPGAGDLGVGDSIERTLAADASLRRLIGDGLRDIELESAHRSGNDFHELAGEGQDDVLRTVEAANPTFFAALVEHTYRGYYTLPSVYAALGLEPRPPQPLGHTLPPFDESLLARQRQRAPFWRRAE